MALEQNTQLGVGGAGMQGNAPGSVAAMVKELQGFSVALLAGAAANTTIPLAAIRKEDTVISALNNSAGTITDITANISINSVNASGTVTAGTVVAGDTVTIAGLTYTLVSNPTVIAAGDYSKVKVGASATDAATNLAAAVNAREGSRTALVTATSAVAVVTITAVAEGVAGNSIALTEVGTTFTVSGAVLAGGTATGGIKSTSVTNQVILYWFNKK